MLEDFSILPSGTGAFDVGDILSSLKRLPTVVALPSAVHAVRSRPNQPENVYVVCASAEQAQRVKAWADQGKTLDAFIGSIAILEVAPGSICVYQPATERVVSQVAQLLLPLLRKQRCRVFSETGEETACATSPELLFS